ncbi:hypothetical protein CWI38_0771p0020 [Hamiltosporidium tvaerminnensis]|uniref:Uncharacterized protein n=1 Tax=Hamiltosporidium tvaerminnensis TaxID=1176355 RepID=A0A4Q9LXH0_9MICR|nr:hypothetical protein CWI38_0771p0020 [Hamiltosporidium tvaerminnensis]
MHSYVVDIITGVQNELKAGVFKIFDKEMLSNNIKTKNNASLYMKEEPKYPKMKNPYRRGKDGGKEVKKNLKF